MWVFVIIKCLTLLASQYASVFIQLPVYYLCVSVCVRVCQCVSLCLLFELPGVMLFSTWITHSEMFILNNNSAVWPQVLIKCCMCVCVCVFPALSVIWQCSLVLKATVVSKSSPLWSSGALGRPLTFHVTLAHSLSYSYGHGEEIASLNNPCSLRKADHTDHALFIEILDFYCCFYLFIWKNKSF